MTFSFDTHDVSTRPELWRFFFDLTPLRNDGNFALRRWGVYTLGVFSAVLFSQHTQRWERRGAASCALVVVRERAGGVREKFERAKMVSEYLAKVNFHSQNRHNENL